VSPRVVGRPGGAVSTLALLVCGLVLALLLVALSAPRLLGVHGWSVVAHLVALRGLVAVGLLTVAVVLVAGPWRRHLAIPAAVLVLAAGVQVAVLADRGLTGAEPAALTAAQRPEGSVVVLVANTQGGVSARDLAGLVAERGADVVALPETWPETAAEVVRLATADGRDLQALGRVAAGADVTGATALLVDRSLGEYRWAADLPTLRAGFTAVPTTGGGPAITAVHTVAPVPGWMSAWRTEGPAVVAGCGASPGAIVAGDLNSSLDHPAFDALGASGCVDAAQVAGAAGLGTWPATLPRVLGTPIDHVLADPEAWAVLRVAVLDPPAGTDHRVLEVVLVPAGSGDAG